jgi:hypothetical protein
VAIGGYRLILEDGPDVSDPEELVNMYAPGCQSLAEARLTEGQARRPRYSIGTGQFSSTPMPVNEIILQGSTTDSPSLQGVKDTTAAGLAVAIHPSGA